MKLKILDIFSGCGGFSVGFHHAVRDRFETVLALDNQIAAVNVFNENFARAQSPVAACVDVAEFSCSTEILAYYLAALNSRAQDDVLSSELSRLGLRHFADRLAVLDEVHRSSAATLATSPGFKLAFRSLPDRERYSSLFSEFLTRYKFPTFAATKVEQARMLWDSQTPFLKGIARRAPSIMRENRDAGGPETRRVATRVRRRLARDVDAIKKVFPALGGFLSSREGMSLLRNQVSWLASRRVEIERFFASGPLSSRLERLYDDRRRVHLIVGGPPCQGFSKWGRAATGYLRRAGLHSFFDENFGDNRNRLFRNYVAFLDALRPDAFVFENVAAFDSAIMVDGRDVLRAGEALTAAVAGLADGGARYETASLLINASRLGVPQNRERYIMLGFRDGSAIRGPAEVLESMPCLEEVPVRFALSGLRGKASHAETPNGRVGWVTLHGPSKAKNGAAGDYTRWIRTDRKAGYCHTTDFHVARQPSSDDEAFFALLSPGATWKSIPLPDLRKMLMSISKKHHFLKMGYVTKRAGRHGDWLSRLDPRKPSRAICAHIGKDGYAYIHPHEPRTISVREAARIQTFPDWFVFGECSLNWAFTLVGNAVPPLLAGHLAERIYGALDPRVGARDGRVDEFNLMGEAAE